MASQKILGFVAALAVVSGGQTAAFAQGTDQQREACTPDAFRLCSQFMPDAGRVESCLRNAGPRLSPACYVVFNPPRDRDDVSQRGARRRNMPPPQSSPSYRDENDDED